jgi:4-amino-4-deoxy-L-arabinose transferase-like glycosyltransferase
VSGPDKEIGRGIRLMAAPECVQLAWPSLRARPQVRVIVYLLLLSILAGVICFSRLSEGTLFGDEAAFACTTDRMRATGDWVVPFIAENPHTNATPLYNWLTLIIAPWLDEAPLWYRFWSAAFGVGCVLIAFALGTRLCSAEVGLLAGLFLIFNRDFVFCHGIRFGAMDAMLAFFIGAATLCYAWHPQRPARATPAWVLVGLCIGLACLSKPPVFGCFFFTFISLHHVWSRPRQPWANRVAGPLLAFAVGLVVAAPWYVLLWHRLGTSCLHALFVYNSVERALNPTLRDHLCCHHGIWHASNGFKFIEPALACAFVFWLSNHRRPRWGLLLLLVVSFLLALSAAGKCAQYIFYVFPLLSVFLAALFLESGPRLAARLRPGFARIVSIAGVALAVVLVGADTVKTWRTLNRPAWVHPPVGIYERLASDLDQQRCHFVLFDFPSAGESASSASASNFEDLYYCPRMPRADRVRDVDELKRLLEDNKPAIVLLPPLSCPRPLLAGLRPDVQVEENQWPFYTYPTLLFHGAATKLTVAELVRLSRGSQP